MKKAEVLKFIDRYYLGETESVKWQISNDKILCQFVSSDRSVKGNTEFTIQESENLATEQVGIYDTSQLKKMISVLDDNISMRIDQVKNKSVAIIFTDNQLKSRYMLADISVIPEVPVMKYVPAMNIEMIISPEFTQRFIGGQSALPMAEASCIEVEDNTAKVTIGYSKINSHTIAFEAALNKNDTKKLSVIFPTKTFSEILKANRSSTTGILELSNEGLGHFVFSGDNWNSEYYCVAIQQDA